MCVRACVRACVRVCERESVRVCVREREKERERERERVCACACVSYWSLSSLNGAHLPERSSGGTSPAKTGERHKKRVHWYN